MNIYTRHNQKMAKLTKWSSLDRCFWGWDRNPSKWDWEGMDTDWSQGWDRPSSAAAVGFIESKSLSPALGILVGRLLAHTGSSTCPGSQCTWVHQAGCVCVKVACRHRADVLHLVPVCLPGIYLRDRQQTEEIHLSMCTGCASAVRVWRYLDRDCSCPWKYL